MKAFRFPLQSLRVLREQKEQAAQKHYAEALRAAEDAAARLKTAADELNVSWATLGKDLATGVTAMELLRTRAWCNALELRVKERTGILEKARLGVDAVWQQMLAATRDRESLDRYYKKNRRAHDRKVQVDEQKQMDELAVRMADTPSPLEFAGQAKMGYQ
jgi:flagellar export protein FliJ